MEKPRTDRLEDLARELVNPTRYGRVALTDPFPHGLRLATPIEHGWQHTEPKAPRKAPEDDLGYN